MLKGWIERCIAGANELDLSRGRSVYIDLERGVFVPVGEAGGTVEGDESRTQRAAKTWWKIRVAEAEDFLEARVCGEDHNSIQAAAKRRPTLHDIPDMLKQLETDIQFSYNI